MNNRFGSFGFASNLSLNTYGSWNKITVGAEHVTADIELKLDSPGGMIGTKRKRVDIGGPNGPEDAFLTLGLGRPTSSSDNSKGSSATACTMTSFKEATTDDVSSADLELNFQLHLGHESYVPKARSATMPKALKTGPVCDLQLSLSTGPPESVITSITSDSLQKNSSWETSMTTCPIQIIDEEVSIVSGWEFGSYRAPSLHQSKTLKAGPIPATPILPSTMIEPSKSPVACTSGVTHSQQQRNTNTKTCQFQGCVKGARGASGLCIAHGGGRRCQKAGCHKGAEGRTVFCKAHGGGRRCQFLGCTKSAEGRTDYCIAHGGGPRCSHEGCIRAARGRSGLCIRHGGGKRCHMENCTKSAEGYSGLCISHGGGRRCHFPQCTKGAQGSTMFCKAHGGGKRCTILGCTKGAEGSTPFCKGHGGGKRCTFQGGGMCPKSVHGGTQFCVAHGGGKRCAVSECTRSARGRTDFCVRHGGGKRCKSDGCGKSAQGSTDFCKAHGGGKRCSWTHGGSPCDRFARGKTGLCAAHNALIQDECVHGGGTLGPAALNSPVTIPDNKLKGVANEDDIFPKMGSEESYMPWSTSEPNKFIPSVSLPEGRVHGGSLLAFLSSNVTGRSSGSNNGEANTSKHGMHQWM